MRNCPECNKWSLCDCGDPECDDDFTLCAECVYAEC